MEIHIIGRPKEIAALVVALQERQSDGLADEVAQTITDRLGAHSAKSEAAAILREVGEERKIIPKSAVVCAARHFVAAHESSHKEQPVDFGNVCVGCSEWNACKGDWLETAASIFDTAGIHPRVIRSSDSLPFSEEDS